MASRDRGGRGASEMWVVLVVPSVVHPSRCITVAVGVVRAVGTVAPAAPGVVVVVAAVAVAVAVVIIVAVAVELVVGP